MKGKHKLDQLLADQFLIFDGAMGTMLQSFGLRGGVLAETLNLEQPEVITQIHCDYVQAGAQAVTTNTFNANRFKLTGSGLEVAAVISQAVTLARRAAGDKLVALDIGPLGHLMEPYGTLSFETAYEAFAEQVRIGAAAGADLVLIETMSDLYEAKAAVLAAKENCSLPVFCTMTFQVSGRTLTGADPITVVNVLQNLGVAALGINCSLGPQEVIPIVDEMLKYAQVPVIVQPNAGLPRLQGENVVFPVSPDEFAAHGQALAAKGVRIVGGCCGTTPAYIHALKRSLTGVQPVTRQALPLTAASSGRFTVMFDGKDTKRVAELNPLTDQSLAEALRSGNMEYLAQAALDLEQQHPQILCLDVSLPEINTAEIVVKAVKEIQGVVRLPLMISSANPAVIAAAARIYNGRLIIGLAEGAQQFADIAPILKKYGCLVAARGADRHQMAELAAAFGLAAESIIAG